MTETRASEHPRLDPIRALEASTSPAADEAAAAQAMPDRLYRRSETTIQHVESGSERSYADAATLAREIEIIWNSGQFDFEFYAKQCPQSGGIELISHYLTTGFGLDYRPNSEFHAFFYMLYYPDCIDGFANPFTHFCANRRSTTIFPNIEAARAYADPLKNSGFFDEAWYRKQYLKDEEHIDPLISYITSGWKRGCEPSRRFSGRYYLLRYPDVFEEGFNPLYHYISSGQKEGRLATFDASSCLQPGDLAFKPSKPTIIVCCHEASRTGAPIVGLNLIWHLKGSHNVITWLVNGGELFDEFKRSSVTIIQGQAGLAESTLVAEHLRTKFAPEYGVLNSAETWSLLEAFYSAGIPTISLIHEFAEYTRPKGKISRMLAFSDVAVFPSNLVRDSALEEYHSLLAPGVPANIMVLPQGRCAVPRGSKPAEELTLERLRRAIGLDRSEMKPRVIFGCGWVQPRKGVDLFVAVARWLKRNTDLPFRFVWVGGNYRPDSDLAYSVWLKDEIVRSGLDDLVFIFKEQESLQEFWSIADVFLLSSRLDPFPNVALDALALGKPVICFEKATGIADLAGTLDRLVHVVPHLDIEAAAKAVVSTANGNAKDHAARSKQTEKFNDRFEFRRYAEAIQKATENLKQDRKAVESEAIELAETGLFDVDFFKSGMPKWAELPRALSGNGALAAQYARFARKGITLAKPRVGFNDARWRGALANGASSALIQAQRADLPAQTHHVYTLPLDASAAGAEAGKALRVGLHVHLFYDELAQDFIHKLTAADAHCDLFVTTDSEEKAKRMRGLLGAFRGGAAKVMIVPNLGRDIGPLFTGLHNELAEYDVIGHLHGKLSPGLGGGAGSDWRNFLLEILIGDCDVFRSIISLFETKPELGLLFPEEPAIVGWTMNKSIAAELAHRMKPGVNLPSHPEFPMGTMFWARRQALQPLFNLNLEWSDYPAEPVPYDGTVLHAIERILPTVVETAGYEWATLYRPQFQRNMKSLRLWTHGSGPQN